MAKVSVFERYAHEYDLITNAAARESYHAKEVQGLIDRFEPTSVLDAGCASGLTSILFARQGIKTVGLDRSEKMLDQARRKVEGLDLPLAFRHGHFEKLPVSLNQKFDLIVCLANSISGLETKANLKKTLVNFRRALRPGGWLVIQTLNYAAINEGEFFPIKATRNDGIVWLRYSHRQGKKLQIHAVRIDMSDPSIPFEPFVHEFENFEVSTVVDSVERAGFASIRRFGDLMMSKKFSKKVRDLVVTGRRVD